MIMGRNNTYEEIAEIIKNSDTIALSGHVSPDGDSIGSCLSLAMTLKKMSKNVFVIMEDIPSKYSYMKGQELIFQNPPDIVPDLFIALDCGDLDRLGAGEVFFKKAKTNIVIDHHISNQYFGEYNLVEPNASSTCELVFCIIEHLCEPDKDIAEAIYSGIISDTGGLRFSSTSERTLNIVGKLLKHNISFTDIYTEIMFRHTYSEAMAFSKVIGKMQMIDNIAYSSISLEEMKALSSKSSELDGISEYMLNTKGAAVSVFAYEKSEGEVKISLRSKSFDVSNIAVGYGGGGHRNAAGCSFSGNISKVLEEVLNNVSGELKKWQ